ncbi:hypothetical protein COO60DRAFT_1701631 [Scenedesmus sp. NREL 46B-D3]|nr:hypothetical protein COO60DRAFT_1701631 [Scenedesmus sp. NREL 46B-D3]
MVQMPGDASWEAMATLHRNTGLRFIIGLPLNNHNEQLMAAMVRKARQVLPAAAIAGFELGNEPMYWEVCPDVKIGAGGWDAAGVYEPGWSAYAAYFDRVAKKLTGCGSSSGSGSRYSKMIVGPGWDNMNTLQTQRSAQLMEAGKCYLKDLSVHFYPYYSKHSFDEGSLLSEDLVREATRNATLHVKAAAAYGQKVRITEANSLSGAGEQGTSDAYAAALWTVDTAFEFAAAGIQSLHFHFGHGGLPGDSVEAGVPVYSGCGRGQIKIWPVVHRGEFAGSTELRVVLLNKSDREDCRVALDVKGNFGDGSLMWMMPDEKSGPERMAAKGIAFGGATFTDWSGLMSDTPAQVKVVAQPRAAAGAGTSYTVQLGLQNDEIELVLLRCPKLFTYNVQARSTPVVEFLSSLGYSQEQLRRVILRFPHVLGYDAKGHLTPHCHYLKSLGLTDEELSRLILMRPHVLVSVADYSLPRLVLPSQAPALAATVDESAEEADDSSGSSGTATASAAGPPNEQDQQQEQQQLSQPPVLPPIGSAERCTWLVMPPDSADEDGGASSGNSDNSSSG